MRRILPYIIVALTCCVFVTGTVIADSDAPKDEKKKTSLGKYITAGKAYEQWKASPDKIFIVDIRTPQEYVFVGHPEMAVNIPFELWTFQMDPASKDALLEQNPQFVADMQKRFKPEDTIYLVCRSGGRSARAANELAKAGFTNVYNTVDGFEGDKIKDPNNPNNGKRMMNGWRNSSAPWTYNLDLKLVPYMTSK